MSPFQQVPKAQKCYKKQYEIKIFVVHNQHMTNTITHTRQMLITKKGCQKQQKKEKQKHIFEECLQLKSAVKTIRKQDFPFA